MERFSIKRFIWTIWDHHFGRETAEERLDLNIYTCRMMVQKFRRLLSELLGHRQARLDIEVEPFSIRFSSGGPRPSLGHVHLHLLVAATRRVDTAN